MALYQTAGFNLQITERTGNTFLFTDLPAGQPITLAVDIMGQDTDDRADVGKWKGLRPFMSYDNPNVWVIPNGVRSKLEE